MPKIALIVLTIFLTSTISLADTFTHLDKPIVYHGYATREVSDGNTVVHTTQKGKLNLNLAKYDIEPDIKGRNNTISVISITDDISLEIETEAFEKAIIEESNKGPLFILLEIDTPGGRMDLAKRICDAIIQTHNCQTVAFIKSGKFGGAYSAGAAVALACDKIYMAEGTAIGAATIVMMSEEGLVDIKKKLGESVAEKLSSAWRNYLASLAQKNNRPGLLAKAMVDKELNIIEVSENGEKSFIELLNKKDTQKLVKTWSKTGSLLTLPADDALKCNIIDKKITSRTDLLKDIDAASAEIIENTTPQKARAKFKKVVTRYNKLYESLDLRFKKASHLQSKSRVIKIIKGIKRDIKKLLLLQKRYPDLNVSPEQAASLRSLLNTVKAQEQKIKTSR